MIRLLRILLLLLVVPPLMAAVMGWLVAPNFLHPSRRPLTPDLIGEADQRQRTLPEAAARRDDAFEPQDGHDRRRREDAAAAQAIGDNGANSFEGYEAGGENQIRSTRARPAIPHSCRGPAGQARSRQ